VPAQQWADEAGVREEAGRVMEPRNGSRRGQQDRLSGLEVQADGVQAPEGNNPVCDRGACAGHHRGLRAGQVCRGGARERGRTPGLRAPCPDWGPGCPQALCVADPFRRGAEHSVPRRRRAAWGRSRRECLAVHACLSSA